MDTKQKNGSDFKRIDNFESYQREMLESSIDDYNKLINGVVSKVKFNNEVYHSNHITQSHLPFTRMEADIFTLILAMLKPDKMTYNFTLKELMYYIKLEPKNYKQFIQSLENLYEKSIIIKHKNEDVEKVRLLGRIKYPNSKNKSINDVVEIDINSSIKHHLFNLKNNFTIYETHSFLRLNSINSKKFYTLFSRFKESETLIISKEQIQEVLDVKYSDFSVLMSRVIKPCLEEIQDKTNIKNITITPIKQGRQIVSYRFKFKNKIVQKEMVLLPPTITPKQLNIFENLITNFNLSERQASIIIEHLPTDNITKELHLINIAKINNKINTSVSGYTITIFKNKYGLTF
jgi:hypothetical protein